MTGRIARFFVARGIGVDSASPRPSCSGGCREWTQAERALPWVSVEGNLLQGNRAHPGVSADAALRSRRGSRGTARLAAFGGLAAAGLGLVAWVAAGPAVAGLAGLAIAAAWIAHTRPFLLGPLVALALPAGQATEALGVQVSPLDAVAGGGAAGYLLFVARSPSARTMWLPHWLYVAFLGCISVSVLGPADDTERLRTLLVLASLGVVLHAVTTRLDDPWQRRYLLVGLGAATLFEATFALYEYVDRWSARFDLRGGAIVYPLPAGTLEHPNALAQFLVLGSLTVAALALSEQGRILRVGVAVAGVASVALLATFSRGSWIAMAAGVAVYALDRRLRLRVLVCGGAVLAGAGALAVASDGAIAARITSLFDAETSSLSNFRVELAGRAARIALDHPLAGVGTFQETGVYAGRETLATHPHDLFLGLAVFFGIPAALVFAALVVSALHGAWARSREGSLTALGCLAALVALLVNGLFEYPLWSESLTAMVVLMLAVAIGAGGRRVERTPFRGTNTGSPEPSWIKRGRRILRERNQVR